MSGLLEYLKATCEGLEYERNMRGVSTTKCLACEGSGHSRPGYSDSDAHGSFWVSPVDCRTCSGRGVVETPCSAAVHVAAIDRKIAELCELRRTASARLPGARDHEHQASSSKLVHIAETAVATGTTCAADASTRLCDCFYADINGGLGTKGIGRESRLVHHEADHAKQPKPKRRR